MRCLFTFVSTLFGIVCLALGGFLLYTVYLDAPESVQKTLGGASVLAQEAVLRSADGLPVTADGDTTEASLFGIAELPSINQEVISVDAVEIAEAEIAEDASRAQANEVISGEAVTNTELDSNPVLQNEVIDSESAVSIVTVDGGDSSGDTDGQGGGGSGLFEFEQRVAELEWPDVFREGETGAVRITLRALEDGGVEAEAEIEGNAVVATPILIRYRYEDYNAFVTGRIQAPDFDVETVSSSTQQMLPGEEVTWRWNLTPNETGNFVITFGVEVFWDAKSGNEADDIGPLPIWGQSVQTQVDQVFGLISIPVASTAGTILAVLGVLLELPFVLDFLSNLFERATNRDSNQRSRRRS